MQVLAEDDLGTIGRHSGVEVAAFTHRDPDSRIKCLLQGIGPEGDTRYGDWKEWHGYQLLLAPKGEEPRPAVISSLALMALRPGTLPSR